MRAMRRMGFATTMAMPPAAQTRDAHAAAVPRGRRAAALLIDLGAGLFALLVALGFAFAWLLVRTGWGARDAGDIDTALTFALIGAVLPVWLAWLALRLERDGATPGQHRVGLRVEATPGREARGRARWWLLLRLAAHPLGIAAWGWLAALAAIADAMWLALPLAFVAASVAAAGVVSAAMLLARPDARTVHDRIAGTRVVRGAHAAPTVRS